MRDDVALIEHFLAAAFTDESLPPRLADAMRYSLLAGGKRLRPVLCLRSALACMPDDDHGESRENMREKILPFAAALEMIHTYSLIHDDLPALDNDDFRRGRPSCHKAHGEATALLAGDALLTDAFAFMASAPLPPERVLSALALVAEAAGSGGMVGGQMRDLDAEGKAISLDELALLNAGKTGALLRASCESGAALAGADQARQSALREYGKRLGIAFQITDDVLDVTGDPARLGKPVGHDAARAKPTWPALLGLDAARALAEEHSAAAAAALAPALFPGEDAEFLRHTATALTSRTF